MQRGGGFHVKRLARGYLRATLSSMQTHIMVGEWGYAVDTDAERAEAVLALVEAGQAEARVYFGDFADDSSYPSEKCLTAKGEILFVQA